jgi:hypothetical protein
MGKVEEIIGQAEILKREYELNKNIESNRNVYEAKTQYQMDMTASLKSLNTYLLFFYYFLFILIHGLFAEQYYRGVPRSEIVDSIVFTGFFIYPAVIYFIESYLYFGITYVLSYIYGNSYVYQFDKLLMSTDFYRDPAVSDSIEGGLPNLTVHTT